MRCYCCNNILTPQQTTRRFKESGEFTDMCDPCLSSIQEDHDLETVEGQAEEEGLFDDDGNPLQEDE